MCAIRLATKNDAKKIREIYTPYVTGTEFTFHFEVPSISFFEKKIVHAQQKHCWLVYELGNEILGYAYATEHRPKNAYQWVVESTIYLDVNHKSKGVGTALYKALLFALEEQGFCKVLAGLTVPNETSEKFHHKFGFKQFAQYTKIGFKNGKWHDVDWFELDIKQDNKLPKQLKSIREVVATKKWLDFIKELS